MKTLIVMAVLVAFGLALAVSGRGSGSEQDDSRIEQGVQQIDSYLEKGLTPEAHDALSKRARESADWLTGIERRAVDATK